MTIDMTEHRLPSHPTHIQETLSSNLSEGQVHLFLNGFANYITAKTLPVTKHVQILLYLSLQNSGASTGVTPLDLLYQLLAVHRPSVIGKFLPIPSDTNATWVARGPVEAEAKRRIKACKDGVWGLLWDQSVPTARDENGEAIRKKVLSERGWDLLQWLVTLWRKDREEYAKAHPARPPVSPLFLAQLPRKASDLQLDDAKPVLAVVRGAFASKAFHERVRRRPLADQVLGFLTDGVQGPSPPFHPASYTLFIISLFRSLSPHSLEGCLNEMWHRCSSSRQTYPLIHVLAIYLEDLGGTRQDKVAARKIRLKGGAEDEGDLVYDKKYGGFPVPSLSYFVYELVRLAPRSSIPDSQTRMSTIKPLLCTALLDIYPTTDPKWTPIQTAGGLRSAVAQTVTQSGLYSLGAVLDIDIEQLKP